MSKNTQICPTLPRLATSGFSWYGGMARLNIIQNERSIIFLGIKSVFFSPKFKVLNFKLSTRRFSCPIRLHVSMIISISGRKQSISWIFNVSDIFPWYQTKERQHLKLLLLVGCGQRHAKQCPNLPRLFRGEFC